MLTPISKPRLSEAAMQQIRELIAGENMSPGDRLPAERELVDKLEISRASVREALRMLEIMGLVEVKPGRGAFIKDLASDLTVPLSSWISGHRETLLNYFEVRLILEPASAGFAALRATPDDLGNMKTRLTAFEAALAGDDLVGLIQADIGFHRLIGQSTKNKTLQLFSDTVSRLLTDCWKATLRVHDRPEKTVREHRAIYRAIRDKDASKAKGVMEQHLKKGLDNLKKLGLG